jgi:predicted site-specific integrase-resolvase
MKPQSQVPPACPQPCVVAYIRMSHDRQEGSPERQREQINAHAIRHGYIIREVYSDLGIAGDVRSRPEFLRLLADARAGKIDVILIDEPSRLSRDGPLEFIPSTSSLAGMTRVRTVSGMVWPLGDDQLAELFHESMPICLRGPHHGMRRS